MFNFERRPLSFLDILVDIQYLLNRFTANIFLKANLHTSRLSLLLHYTLVCVKKEVLPPRPLFQYLTQQFLFLLSAFLLMV